MLRQLPRFNGYTVDARLKEFRKAEIDEPLEFVHFDSDEGEELLLGFIKTLDPETPQDREMLCSLW
jgi:hypothetical protein